jgi:hypothetical protein
MADFTTPEEFERYLAAMKEQYEAGYISAKDYNEALKDSATGVKGYTANLRASMAQLGTSFKQLGKDMYAGKQGAAVFNDSLDSGANAVAAYAMKFGPAGVAVGLFTKAVAMFVGAANKQSDLLYESYQKISRSGTIGADAMTQVFESAVKMGYTVDQLGNLGTLLANNSKNIGLFASSAVEGAKQFIDIGAGLQTSGVRQYFFNLGLTVDDINNGMAGFYKQEGALGQLRGRSTQDLIKGSQAYIREMEILTRLTGQTREEMEAQREEALNVDAFYASLMDLPADAQKEALNTYNRLAAVNQKAAAEFAANFSGAITGSTDLLISTQGQSLRLSKDAFAAGMKSSEAMQILSDSSRPMIQATKEVAQVGGQIGLTTRTMVQLGNKGLDPLQKQFNDISKDVDKAGEGFDSATNSQGKMRDSQIRTAQNLQSFVNLGVNPATKAMQMLTESVEYLTSFLPSRKKAQAATAAAQATTATGSGTDAGGSMGGMEVPTAGTAEPAAPAGRGTDTSGLKLKSAESVAGGGSTEALVALAYTIQDKLGGDLKYFSGLNDTGRDANSKHKAGRAIDVVLNDPSKYGSVLGMIKSMGGVSFAQYEQKGQVNANGSIATGDHIHAEVSAAQGAILSGPMSGYRPNLTMHGTEAVVPLNTTAQQAAAGMSDGSMMQAQLDKLDEMVSVLKNQLSVSTKIMQYSS